jgi:endonuclease/exonuclease/phosphatase family metal-dependent hydrolase
MKLISLNIEGRKHWERINPFIETELPDVVCFQEIFEIDAKGFADRFSLHYAFMSMVVKEGEQQGVALFSRCALANIRLVTYHDKTDDTQPFDKTSLERMRETERQAIILADIEIDGALFTVSTTHFTWTPDGLVNNYQKEDAAALLKILADVPEVIICGDFNVPRGFNEIYDLFAGKYADAIPQSYASSLDPLFHRAYKNPEQAVHIARFMVDYLFTSERYTASDVRLQFGLSDHGAIVASISSHSSNVQI